ncbi:Lyso-phosphatidylcholine acyltransferase [Tieghemiomyces parasiticus]|uniref:Tafazzin family protein n=1 Tax=Tieghemiomyces parasiticus TaxID=78921 RepID=A0A9W8DSS4_9FUNG|nr:Lyso-phosphatidylcholine acyltransferase [Tieghemiomyces parasiticus]
MLSYHCGPLPCPKTQYRKPPAGNPPRAPKVRINEADRQMAHRLRCDYIQVDPETTPGCIGLIRRTASFLCIIVTALVTKAFLRFFAHTKVFGAAHLIDLLHDRETCPRPLLTVANHISAVDDPLLWGFVPLHYSLNRQSVRWCIAAKDILFTNPISTALLSLCQTIPVVRGGGVRQPFIDNAIDRLNHNKWVHIFPEGKVYQTSCMGYFRWGVARLVMEARTTPLVVPIWHAGMDKVLPLNRRVPLPVPGQQITIAVGEPLDFAPLLRQAAEEGWSTADTRARIARVIKNAIDLLGKQHITGLAPIPAAA